MDPAMSASLHEGIKVLYLDNALTDVVIRVEGQVFPCHRLVLSAVSPYFRSMFTNNFKEKETGEVVLKSIEPEILQCILQYIYFSDKSVINEANVQEILTTASMFLMQHVVDVCEKFLSDKMSVKNAINVWRFAESIPLKTLAQFAKDFILREFVSIAKGDAFLDLEANEITEIIKDQTLNVINEENVGDAVFRWMAADEEARKSNLYQILQCVRLPLTSPEYVFSLSKRYPFMYENLDLIQLLDEAKYFHCHQKSQNNCESKRFIYRNSSEMVNGMICVVGKYAQLYSFQDQKVTDAKVLPRDPGNLFASCVDVNNLYISGGSNNELATMYKYQARENQWVSLQGLGKIRIRHALVANSQRIYLLGGSYGEFDLSSDVTEYNKNQNRYKHIGSLDTPVRSMNAALVEQHIYIFGGRIAGNNISSRMIQCYDLSTNQGTQLTSEVFVGISFTGATKVGETVYLASGDGYLYEWRDGDLRRSHACDALRSISNSLVMANMCYHDGQVFIHTGRKQTIDIIHLETGKHEEMNCYSDLIKSRLSKIEAIFLPKKYFERCQNEQMSDMPE